MEIERVGDLCPTNFNVLANPYFTLFSDSLQRGKERKESGEEMQSIMH
jgi:hypothetical protein